MHVASAAIDRLHTTAEAHDRVMVVEVMGRDTGHIAVRAGLAGGATMTLIPEVPFDIAEVCDALVRRHAGKSFASIVVVAEGAVPVPGTMEMPEYEVDRFGHARLGGIGQLVASEIEGRTGIETRVTTLGYVQRGGTPTAFDRILATRYGIAAADAAAVGRLGPDGGAAGRPDRPRRRSPRRWTAPRPSTWRSTTRSPARSSRPEVARDQDRRRCGTVAGVVELGRAGRRGPGSTAVGERLRRSARRGSRAGDAKSQASTTVVVSPRSGELTVMVSPSTWNSSRSTRALLGHGHDHLADGLLARQPDHVVELARTGRRSAGRPSRVVPEQLGAGGDRGAEPADRPRRRRRLQEAR